MAEPAIIAALNKRADMANDHSGAQALYEALGVAPGEGLRGLDPARGEQEDLFDAECEDFSRQFPSIAASREARGPGRPKGARNRVTPETLRLLQAAPGFVAPLVCMASAQALVAGANSMT